MTAHSDADPGGAQPVSTYTLGPLPWSEKTLIDATWKAPIAVRDQVGEHPGKELDDKTRSIAAALRIFNRTAARIQERLTVFQTAACNGTLFWRSRAGDLRQFEEELQELLYVFASSAMTLVDQTRVLIKQLPLEGYDDRIAAQFAENPVHRFVQELRNDVIHVRVHEPSWQLAHKLGETPVARFLLKPDDLTRSCEYSLLAKKYLDDHRDGIDLRQLVDTYAATVADFHEWLRQSIDVAGGHLVSDYRRCIRCTQQVSARALWRIILSQVLLPTNRDPYPYLEQYLTKEELAEVGALPHKSKEQVDRIIELVDDLGVCDSELRGLAYKAFGVAGQ